MIKNILRGFLMGMADIIPGVSGGTMAYILGIYERLIGAICAFNGAMIGDILHLRFISAFKRADFLFLLTIGIGIIFSFIIFTKIFPLPFYLEKYPHQIYGLFFGLIIGSIFVLFHEVPLKKFLEYIYFAIGIIAGFALVNLVPINTSNNIWFIFLCGFIAISAMLLPGISGSFILLIMGKYKYMLSAISAMNMVVILPFIAGMICGLIIFSRVISLILCKYHNRSIAFINGILIGSLWKIYPYKIGAKFYIPQINMEFFIVIILMIFGANLVSGLHRRSIGK